MFIGGTEDVGSIFGKPLKELTDIELLAYLTARKYYIGELKRYQNKDQEKELTGNDKTVIDNGKCTIEKLLKYNMINKGI